MVITVCCVPIMLCVKPIVISLSHRNDVHEDVNEFADDDAFQPADGGIAPEQETEDFGIKKALLHGNEKGGDNHSFSDLFIHQMIETIEFVLGTISNTASYLRLWALSLAHSQLAKVFFDQVLGPAMAGGSVIGCFLAFFVFMGATTAVLMMMDVMECGLHTLRLHWVEFQNKFYKGVGNPFTPIKISEILTAKYEDKNRNLGE